MLVASFVNNKAGSNDHEKIHSLSVIEPDANNERKGSSKKHPTANLSLSRTQKKEDYQSLPSTLIASRAS